MALGARIFGGLLSTNAVVDVESPTVSVTGGVTQTWAAATSSVDVLITRASSAREPRTGTDAERDGWAVSGVNDALRFTHTRLKITAFPDRPEFVGKYLRVESSAAHPKGRGGLLRARITCQCSVLDLPADLS